MKRTIAAVIVTFNRKELLLKNICACIKQSYLIEKIIIIDNHSTDGTKEFIFDHLNKKELTYIDYVYLDSNTGGSGGFYQGTKYAFELGFDFIWLMDDDGRPYNEDTLKLLMEHITKNNLSGESFMINSLVINNNNNLSFGIIQDNSIVYKVQDIKYGFIRNFCNDYNGTLISRQLIEKIGLPRGDYFIKGDEKEYLMRTISFSQYCGTVTTSLYYHPSPINYQDSKVIFGKEILNNIESGWKEYYNMRNVCYNYKMYEKFSILKRLRFYLVRVFKIILFSNDKKKILKMCTIGYKHANKGLLGKYYLPSGEVNPDWNS